MGLMGCGFCFHFCDVFSLLYLVGIWEAKRGESSHVDWKTRIWITVRGVTLLRWAIGEKYDAIVQKELHPSFMSSFHNEEDPILNDRLEFSTHDVKTNNYIVFALFIDHALV